MCLMHFLKHKARTFTRQEEGVAFIEFAFAITILLLLFLGCVELTRYVIIIQKLEKTVSEVADVVTQTDPSTSPLTDLEMSQLMDAVQYMMSPYTTMSNTYTSSNTRIIITDIQNISSTATPNPVIMWQFCSRSGLSGTSYYSKLGNTSSCTAGSTCTITDAQFGAAGFSTGTSGFRSNMQTSEELVVGEVYYAYLPITNQKLLTAATLYRMAAFMPRLGALTSYVPNSTYSGSSPEPSPVPSSCP